MTWKHHIYECVGGWVCVSVDIAYESYICTYVFKNYKNKNACFYRWRHHGKVCVVHYTITVVTSRAGNLMKTYLIIYKLL